MNLYFSFDVTASVEHTRTTYNERPSARVLIKEAPCLRTPVVEGIVNVTCVGFSVAVMCDLTTPNHQRAFAKVGDTMLVVSCDVVEGQDL